MTTIVQSLEHALTVGGRREAAQLAGLRGPEQPPSPVDIHIRLERSQVEVEVTPAGRGRPAPAPRSSSVGEQEFRTWLLQRLRAEGLSQESAARRIGVSTRTVGRWARGQTQPRMRDLGRVREALGDLPAF